MGVAKADAPPPTWSWRIAASAQEVAERVTVVDASVVVDWVAPGAGPNSAAMATLRRLGEQAEASLPLDCSTKKWRTPC